MNRRSHYEMAFERYLDERGTPYVPVEAVANHAHRQTAAKAFDYIVYPPGGRACLIEVKGRKAASKQAVQECRGNNWTTIEDVRGLITWKDVFGPDYDAAFVFGYWLASISVSESHKGPLDVRLAGRAYRFYLVPAEDDARHQKIRSRKWRTISIPTERFVQVTRPLSDCWPMAPC